MKVWRLIIYTLIGMTLLITAIVLAVTGHMLGAIFTAILWVGYTNNSSHTVAYHQRAGTLPGSKETVYKIYHRGVK